MSRSPPLLSVRDLTVRFGEFVAVDRISFEVHNGETLAIVGESGSGKSVTALSVMGLLNLGRQRVNVEGQVVFRKSDGSRIDLLQCPESSMRRIRGREISMIFQEPLTSLNPVSTVGNQVVEALTLHQKLSRPAARLQAVELFDQVRIPEPRRLLKLYPHQLSGGMRQRVMIAMALSCRPSLLIADEPTSAIDVTVQAQILALLRQLQRDRGLTVVFITHDMGVVAEIADRVVVMSQAKVVEQGTVYNIFEFPQKPYTEALLAAVPRLGSMAGTDHPARF
jgi:glutathione transport system ATP-binding protein